MSKIFISYKRVDKEKVFNIKNKIEAAIGERCWIDLKGIESDAQFASVIINAIDDAKVVLFMHSAAHCKISDFENDWTIRELNYANEEKKRIVFVNIDKTPLTKWFKFMFPQKQEVDSSNPESMEQLFKDLRCWLGSAVSLKAMNTSMKSNELLGEQFPIVFHREVYKNQDAMHRKFADISINVEPADESFTGMLQFINKGNGRDVPNDFLPFIEKGFIRAIQDGILQSCNLRKIKVVLVTGSFHPLESDGNAFECVAYNSLKNVCKKIHCSPV